MLIKNKKGMVDDTFDLLFTVASIFFILIFISVVLNINAAAKEEVALEKFEVFTLHEELLVYLNSPVEVKLNEGDKKITLRENLVIIANSDDSLEEIDSDNMAAHYDAASILFSDTLSGQIVVHEEYPVVSDSDSDYDPLTFAFGTHANNGNKAYLKIPLFEHEWLDELFFIIRK
jgi:hypothetical protein